MSRVLEQGDIVQATLVTKMGDQVALNSLFYLVGITANASALDVNFALQLDTAIATHWKALLNNTAEYMGLMAQVVNPPPIQRRQVSTGGAGVGVGGATPLPTQTSGIISWQTAMAGRTGRGRLYVPFPATAFMDSDGSPTAGYVTALGNLAVDIGNFNIVTGGGAGDAAAVTFVLYHRAFNTTDVINGSNQEKKWATQRRRGEFGKPNVSPI